MDYLFRKEHTLVCKICIFNVKGHKRQTQNKIVLFLFHPKMNIKTLRNRKEKTTQLDNK